MRILLLGSNGQLGKELERQLSEVGTLEAFSRSLLDITNYKLVKDTVGLINPNIIAVENIDDPPRLKSGKGIPVKGINPRIVSKFINICTPKRINNPERRYFSNSI